MILYLTMVLLTNIEHIIVGWFNLLFKNKPPYYYNRMLVCKKCIYKSKLFFCKDCGCYIPAKCAYAGEYCNKWKNETSNM